MLIYRDPLILFLLLFQNENIVIISTLSNRIKITMKVNYAYSEKFKGSQCTPVKRAQIYKTACLSEVFLSFRILPLEVGTLFTIYCRSIHMFKILCKYLYTTINVITWCRRKIAAIPNKYLLFSFYMLYFPCYSHTFLFSDLCVALKINKFILGAINLHKLSPRHRLCNFHLK